MLRRNINKISKIKNPITILSFNYAVRLNVTIAFKQFHIGFLNNSRKILGGLRFI